MQTFKSFAQHTTDIQGVFLMMVKNLRDDRKHLNKQLLPGKIYHDHFFFFQPFEGDRGQKPSVLNALKVV